MGQKVGGYPPFHEGSWSPFNTMWPGRGLPAYQVTSWSIQPFSHNTPTHRQTGQWSDSMGWCVL